jgi:hypothetical protein
VKGMLCGNTILTKETNKNVRGRFPFIQAKEKKLRGKTSLEFQNLYEQLKLLNTFGLFRAFCKLK